MICLIPENLKDFMNQENALIGCLLGTAIGDALGLSYEGLSPQRSIKLYPAFNKYHFIFGKGMVSDDTEHTCFVAQSLINSDIETFKSRFAWKLRFWFLGLPAGVGFATLRSIFKLWLGFSPNKSGVFSAGNAPAMRSAIIGVYYGHDRDKLKSFVKASTLVTHTDPKAEFGALAVALAASFKENISPQDYFNQLSELLKSEPAEEFLLLIKKAIDNIGDSSISFAQSLGFYKGVSGYIYQTMPIVIHVWLRNQEDYQSAILDIIRCGGDTDTTAAIVGGIIGARVGKQGIPQPWLENLWEFPRNIKWMEKLGQDLSCKKPQPLRFFVIPAILLRNFIFLIVVLLHGFRRLLPPY